MEILVLIEIIRTKRKNNLKFEARFSQITLSLGENWWTGWKFYQN